jgi:hypothetical protein
MARPEIALSVDRTCESIPATVVNPVFTRWKNGMVDYIQETSFYSVAFSVYRTDPAEQAPKKK